MGYIYLVQLGYLSLNITSQISSCSDLVRSLIDSAGSWKIAHASCFCIASTSDSHSWFWLNLKQRKYKELQLVNGKITINNQSSSLYKSNSEISLQGSPASIIDKFNKFHQWFKKTILGKLFVSKALQQTLDAAKRNKM